MMRQGTGGKRCEPGSLCGHSLLVTLVRRTRRIRTHSARSPPVCIGVCVYTDTHIFTLPAAAADVYSQRERCAFPTLVVRVFRGNRLRVLAVSSSGDCASVRTCCGDPLVQVTPTSAPAPSHVAFSYHCAQAKPQAAS